MKLDGARLLPGKRTDVWLALNDPEVLKACIPGCEQLTANADGGYEALIVASIGPVRARLSGALGLADVIVNESYTLRFDLQGGVAGFGRGDVQVRLQDEPAGSSLHYVADAKVGGRIAQLGSRLIEGAAKKLSEEFFERFAALVASRSSVTAAPADAAVDAASSGALATKYRIGLGALVGVALLAWWLS